VDESSVKKSPAAAAAAAAAAGYDDTAEIQRCGTQVIATPRLFEPQNPLSQPFNL